METTLTGEELKRVFTLDDWVQALNDDDIVKMSSNLSPGGAIVLRTEDDEYQI